MTKFKPQILQPRESVVLFQLTLKSVDVSSDLKLKSFLTIHTNISNVEVPLLSYNGKLTLVCILIFFLCTYSVLFDITACGFVLRKAILLTLLFYKEIPRPRSRYSILVTTSDQELN